MDQTKLDSYFSRIGYSGSPKADLETLRDLHRLHTLSIPFENLTPFLYQEVLLDPKSIHQKLVKDKRGGYCFEQNLLFLDILKELGFSAKGLGARVLWNTSDDEITRRSHMLLSVAIDGVVYLADVGFGGLTLTTPIKFEIGLHQDTTHERFRLVSIEDDFKLQAEVDGLWKTLYRFDTQEQYLPDYEVANFYLFTHPASPFRTALIAAKPVSGGRLALSNRQLTVYTLGKEPERRELGDVEQVKKTLIKDFGVNISQLSNLDERLKSLFES